MAVDQELDQRLRSAIRNKQLLEFNYQGNDRVVEPHDYGIQNGIVRLLCWQVGGRMSTIRGEKIFYSRKATYEVALTRNQRTVLCKVPFVARSFVFAKGF